MTTAEADEKPEYLKPHGGQTELTLLFPPFRASGARGGPSPSEAHDPVRARRTVETLLTVDAVLEQLPDRRKQDLRSPEVRADLDLVAVGCWGNGVQIFDPAWGDNGLTGALLNEVGEQRRLNPQARIVGWVDMDYGLHFTRHVVNVPEGAALSVEGWDSGEGWTVRGDPEEVLRAAGIDPASVRERYIRLEDADDPDDPGDRYLHDWDAYAGLFHEGFDDLGDPDLKVSVFRVRRTRRAESDIREAWWGS
ncbi:DUF6333 family protein [Streptomyces sp. NPDC053427]|uniref:DUF6333 family protein n=1 Tax=Streptomyces sp. NPDC053427 TaxID=3365701 RepID=UPI0037D11EC5